MKACESGLSRFEAFIKKTGKALHQADAEIDEVNFLASFDSRNLVVGM